MVTWGLPTHTWSIAVNIPLDRCNAKTYGRLGASCSYSKHIPLGPAHTPCSQAAWGLPAHIWSIDMNIPVAIMLVSLKYSIIIHIHHHILHHTLHHHYIIIACIIYAWIYWFILQELVFKPGYIIQIFNSQTWLDFYHGYQQPILWLRFSKSL